MGEATPLCGRIKIRCFDMGEATPLLINHIQISCYRAGGVEQYLHIFFCFMYFSLSCAWCALFARHGRMEFQVNEPELKGYFVRKWIDFFWVVFK